MFSELAAALPDYTWHQLFVALNILQQMGGSKRPLTGGIMKFAIPPHTIIRPLLSTQNKREIDT